MDRKKTKIIFMGTPEIAGVILKGLIDSGYNIVLVVCGEDKPVGRKGILTPPCTKIIANQYNIPTFQPKKIRMDYQPILDAQSDAIVTCAYGQIVPDIVLKAPKKGCINVHGSLLPHLRGASPIQSALFEGLDKSGVTIMEMVSQMDAGKMYLKKEVKIEKDDNYSSLYSKIAQAGKEALLSILDAYLEGKLLGTIQEENEATFCKKISKDNEKLSLDLSPKDFVNRVRGLSYTPGGYLFFEDKKIKILRAEIYSDEVEKEKGSIIKKDKKTWVLQLQKGQVKLLEVQKENKNRMDFIAFANGERNLENKKFN